MTSETTIGTNDGLGQEGPLSVSAGATTLDDEKSALRGRTDSNRRGSRTGSGSG
jgi:hypothetical protein